MKLPRKLPLFRSLRFAPLAILSLFLFSNFTGIFFSSVLAPEVSASAPVPTAIPADVPSSGNPDIDRLIFDTAEREGVDPRFVHAVIWQESRYVVDAQSHA